MKTFIFLSGIILLHCHCAHDPARGKEPVPDTKVMEGQVTAENVPAPRPEADRDRSRPIVREANPQILRQPLPVYPPEAVEAQVSCEVKLLYHVEKDGSATAVRFNWVMPPPDKYLKAFEAAILEAVPEWRFQPAVRYIGIRMPDGSVEPGTRAVTR
ncbi:MAG: energy transducer TonB, partial [Acidobacteriota bacterium]